MEKKPIMETNPRDAAAAFEARRAAKAYGRPRPTSLPYLDLNMYRKNTHVLACFKDWTPGFRGQMMAVGNRRFLFDRVGKIIEVTDPLRPTLINKNAYKGGPQLAYNKELRKWILMVSAGVPGTFPTPQWPLGKYSSPELVERSVNHKGLRGLRIYDATDPSHITLLSEWSCDQGDPKRERQTGSGAAGIFYDGGQYAYLDTAPDDSFKCCESAWRVYGTCLQILDVSDPTKPKFVTNWWIPGQRIGEEEEAKKWPEYGNRVSSNSLHTAVVLPKRIEEGGRYAYGTWGSFGFFIHDLSDIKAPRTVGRFNPPKEPGGWPFHTVDLSKLDRGFVITNSEPLYPDGEEAFQPLYIIDVRDPANPKEISKLPEPVPPPDAPYRDFRDKRGRFGAFNPPYPQSPGKPDPNFTAYSFFNAGLQIFDISDPKDPRITGYFIPPQAGRWEEPDSHARDSEMLYVEWDRKLMWVGSLTGLYLVTSPLLGEPLLKPMAVEQWALPNMNEGHE